MVVCSCRGAHGLSCHHMHGLLMGAPPSSLPSREEFLPFGQLGSRPRVFCGAVQSTTSIQMVPMLHGDHLSHATHLSYPAKPPPSARHAAPAQDCASPGQIPIRSCSLPSMPVKRDAVLLAPAGVAAHCQGGADSMHVTEGGRGGAHGPNHVRTDPAMAVQQRAMPMQPETPFEATASAGEARDACMHDAIWVWLGGARARRAASLRGYAYYLWTDT